MKKLSVAVVVDGDVTTDAAGKTTYKARSPKEMSQIEALVKSAIGFDAKRGDLVQVTNMEFARLDAGPITPEAAPLLGFETSDWVKVIEVAILSITALLIGFFVMRPLITRMFTPASAMAPQMPDISRPRKSHPAKPGSPSTNGRRPNCPARSERKQDRHLAHRWASARIRHQEGRRSGAVAS